MNCKTTRNKLLTDPHDAGDAAVRHMASCPECRELKTVLESLDATGREIRGADLSPGRIKTTRREALQILAAGRRAPLVRWRPVTALAAAAVLLVAAVFGGYEFEARRQAAEAERLAVAALDRRIERLQAQVAAFPYMVL